MSGMHQPMGDTPLAGNHAKDPILHAIDFEDVSLTAVGAQMIQLGAKAVLNKYMPAADTDRMTDSQAASLFLERVYWEENTGGLILCTSVAETSLCLPIPKAHWSVHINPRHVH